MPKITIKNPSEFEVLQKYKHSLLSVKNEFDYISSFAWEIQETIEVDELVLDISNKFYLPITEDSIFEIKEIENIGVIIFKNGVEYIFCGNIDNFSSLNGYSDVEYVFLNRFSSLNGIENLHSLIFLCLYGAQLGDIQSILLAKNLKKLSLNENFDMLLIPHLTHLEAIYIKSSVQLEIDISLFANLLNLKELRLDWASYEGSLSQLSHLPIQSLELIDSGLENCCELENFHHLSKLKLEGYITDILSLSRLKNLTELFIIRLEIESLNGIQYLTQLRSLTIVGMSWLFDNENTDVKILQKLNALEKLIIIETSFKNISDLQQLDHLRILKLSECPIESLCGIEQLNALWYLEIKNCNELTDIQSLSNLTQLKHLEIEKCENFIDFSCFKGIQNVNLEKFRKMPIEQIIDEEYQTEAFKLAENLGKQYWGNFKNIIHFANVLIENKTKVGANELSLSVYDEMRIECKSIFYIPYLENYLLDIEVVENKGILITSNEKEMIFIAFNNIDNLTFLKDYPDLQYIGINGCNIKNLDGISNLPKLKDLQISDCDKLCDTKGVYDLIELKTMRIENCKELKTIEGFEGLSTFDHLEIFDCTALQSFPGLQNVFSLTGIDCTGCSDLKDISGLKNSFILFFVVFDGCTSLENIEVFSHLTELSQISFVDCTSLKSLKPLKKTKSLSQINLRGCHSLVNLDGLENVKKYKGQSLYIFDCYSLENIDGIAGFIDLEYFRISDSNKLKNINVVANFEKLISFSLSDCSSIQEIKPLEKLKKLNRVSFYDLKSLKNLSGIENLNQLTSLSIIRCNSLENIDELSQLNQLKSLDLSGCKNLTNIDGLNNLINLKELNLSNCKKIKNIECLRNLSKLTKLNLSNCKSITDLSPLDALPFIFIENVFIDESY